MPERITIAIPFHRGLEYLREAVESVRCQTSDRWRLVVLDDSGTGAAAETVESFADSRIEYRRHPVNLGMAECWNEGLALGEGGLVTLLHADDCLLPGYVSLMLGLAADHPAAAALFCGASIVDGDGAPTFSLVDRAKVLLAPRTLSLDGDAGLQALMRANFIMCPTLCFRTSVLGGRRFSVEWSQVQDLELTTRLLMDGETLVGSRAVAYAYRRHAESATERHASNLLRFDEEFRLCDAVADRAAELGWTRAARTARSKRMARLYLLYRAAADLLGLRPSAAAAKLRFLVSR